MKVLWLSSRAMTVRIVVDEQLIIREAAPIVRRFIGQHKRNLKGWMRSHGGLKEHYLGWCDGC